MEQKSGIWFKKLTKKEVNLLNKNIVIFAFFLFLAFIFWYLNSLGKVINSDFKYTVTFTNPPKGRAISSDLPSKLFLELKGQGYSLLKNKISRKRSDLVVDFSKVTFKRIPDTKPVKFYILSSGLIPGFKKQIGNGFDVISVRPDTIFLTFKSIESLTDKKLK
jgi:hypothetical protein